MVIKTEGLSEVAIESQPDMDLNPRPFRCSNRLNYQTMSSTRTQSRLFFSMEMRIYRINIRTTVTWHHNCYGCQEYKNSLN